VVRQQLEHAGLEIAEAPEDDDVRQTYNFAPGNIGLIYRADVPDYGAGPRSTTSGQEDGEADCADKDGLSSPLHQGDSADVDPKDGDTRYKLQAMKWGLIPSWTKRNPNYDAVLRTINCRDDSLMAATSTRLWQNMKKRKRCLVVCHGFYEWLHKNNGKDKIPHYIKRKDGQLMLFAGLWDCVKYDGMAFTGIGFLLVADQRQILRRRTTPLRSSPQTQINS
jgi:putative SOS response-associated peptidase YedK